MIYTLFIMCLLFVAGIYAQDQSQRTTIGIFSLAMKDTKPPQSKSTLTSEIHETSPESSPDLLYDSSFKSSISNSYVKWLEQNDVRVVVIPYDAPDALLQKLFKSVNGILFTGGGLSLDFDTTYFINALKLYKMAIAANQNGDHFPVWGTCQGFQLIHIMQSYDHDILHCDYDSWNLALPLHFLDQAKMSRLYGALPYMSLYPYVNMTMYDYLATKATTMNLHHCGIRPDEFAKNEKLTSFFNVLSVNQDSSGKPFVSTIEGKYMPIFGTQWHGERTQFDWSPYEHLDHSLAASSIVKYVSSVFVNEAKKNTHKFETEQDELNALIYNYPLKFVYNTTADKYSSLQVYYFPSFSNN